MEGTAEIIEKLILAAQNYRKADQKLEDVCGETMDPIACTIYARKGIKTTNLPTESFSAARFLNEVLNYHLILVRDHSMDNDAVRNIWFPILNGQ